MTKVLKANSCLSIYRGRRYFINIISVLFSTGECCLDC